MQTFDLYDPRDPQPKCQLLRTFRSPSGEDGVDFYFIKKSDHLLIYREELHTFPRASTRAGETKLIANQFEIPISAIRWLISVIEQKFFKPPEEGGLPANKISYKETVSGEKLHVMRSMRGGVGSSGYVVTNSSRRSYIISSACQKLDLPDPWLFEKGLMDYLKELADLYEQGKL